MASEKHSQEKLLTDLLRGAVLPHLTLGECGARRAPIHINQNISETIQHLIKKFSAFNRPSYMHLIGKF
jgi:hypothetical protein